MPTLKHRLTLGLTAVATVAVLLTRIATATAAPAPTVMATSTTVGAATVPASQPDRMAGARIALAPRPGADPPSDTTNPPPSATGMFNPQGVAVDFAGNLYVSDTGNNRVLLFKQPLANLNSPNETANLSFGQAGSADFTNNGCNQTGAPSEGTLCAPTGLTVDTPGNLYVADTQNNRVLKFDTPLNSRSGEKGAGDTIADDVFGQDGFFGSVRCNEGTLEGDLNGVGPDSLCGPGGVAADALGNVYIADTQNNRVLKFLESGAQQAAGLNLSTGAIDFGKAVVFTNGLLAHGATTAAKKITLKAVKRGKNVSPVVLNISRPAGPFSIVTSRTSCGQSLMAGKSCAISLKFTPSAIGLQSSSLVIVSNASNGPAQSIALSGSGVMGRLSAPKSVGFGETKVLHFGATKTITLSNDTGAEAELSGHQVRGAESGDFREIRSDCGSSLPGHSSCHVSVQFIPSAHGSRSAELQFNYDSAASPERVTLTGFGR